MKSRGTKSRGCRGSLETGESLALDLEEEMASSLESCLSRVGYTYKDRVRQDVNAVLRSYGGLAPEVATYST